MERDYVKKRATFYIPYSKMKTFAILAVAWLILFQAFSSCVQVYGQGPVYVGSNQTATELALGILQHVGGINLTSSTVRSQSSSRGRFWGDSQHEVTTVFPVIEENNYNLSFRLSFIDGRLWTLDLDQARLTGDKTLNDSLSIAGGAVEGYRELFNASYCGEFADMISKALQNQNLTVENDDALLQISHVENCTTEFQYRVCTQLVWYRKMAGACSSWQSMTVSISKDGHVSGFMDNLASFYVATRDINVSQADAINKTMPYAEAYAEAHGQKVVWSNASLMWERDRNSIRGDSFAIYPQWEVDFSYDVKNNESAFGYWAVVWADSGQVMGKGPVGVYSSERGGNPLLPWIGYAVVAISATVPAIACFATYMKRKNRKR